MKATNIHLPISRREFLQAGSIGAAASMFPHKIFGGEAKSKIVPITKEPVPIIIFWLSGGASHFDSFDPRENSAPERSRGPFKSIPTTKPGIYVSELLPNMATNMGNVALFKNIYHTQGDHNMAAGLCLTGNEEVNRSIGNDLTHPPRYNDGFGITYAKHLRSERDTNTSGYLILNTFDEIDIWGTIQSDHREAFLVGCDLETNQYNSPFGTLSDEATIAARRSLSKQLGTALSGRKIKDYEVLESRAEALLSNKRVHEAFNIEKEPQNIRERYGDNPLGNAALIARRMVTRNFPLVFINDGFWDSHYNISLELKELLPRLDQALSAIIEEQKELGFPCTIVVASEFGRTPLLNSNKLPTGISPGRDHWPYSNFMLLAGTNINGGTVIGKVNNAGYIVGNDGEYNAEYMGETFLNLAGYARLDSKGKRFPSMPIPFAK